MKLLAISKAGHSSVNREVYTTLCRQYKHKVTLVIPRYLMINNKKVDSDPFNDPPYEIIALALLGVDRSSRYRGILGVLKYSKPDIVYYEDDPMTFSAILLGVWCKWKKKKFACRTNHNRPLKIRAEIARLGPPKGLLSAVIKMSLMAISAKFIDHLFVISNDGMRIFSQMGLTNVSKIPLGFNEERFKINDEERTFLRNELNINSIVISYMGRIFEGKGVHILIEALNQIKEQDWVFLVDKFELYSDPYKKKIDSLIGSYGLKKRTIFFDADHTQIASYMNASDIIVVPSITTDSFKEEYGRIAPEAMGAGCLVVVSDSGTLPELVSDSGWVFQEGNIDELAGLLKKLILQKNKKSLGESASKFAHENLGLNKQALIMNEIFKNLVTKKQYKHQIY